MTKCMKRHILMYSLLATGLLMTSCSEISVKESCTPDAQNTVQTDANGYLTRTFAQPDGSKALKGTPAENLKALLEAAGSDIITSLGRINITEEQYQEIATFTTDLVKDKATQTDKFKAVLAWIRKNIKYEHSDNDPYAVFVNRKAICQGYANLMTVMCYSQGIPTVVVNGYLEGVGGHAWVYACPDNVWEVSDPTNYDVTWKMSNTQGYSNLIPSEIDVDIFTDNSGTYRYYNYSLNVNSVTATTNPLVVPYSVGGFVVSSFNPSESLPESVTEIYLGENITTLGESYDMTLATRNYGANIRAIHVDEKNPMLYAHKGIVYKKNGDEKQLYYIPGGMEYVELLPMKLVDKNTIYNHANVTEICFPEGTEEVSSYAIENCPKLKRVYVPEGTKVSSAALYNCPKDVEIIYGIPSGIKHVTM